MRFSMLVSVGCLAASDLADAAMAADVNETQGVQLEEIIVTAEKREERLQDVPMSMSVVSADRLTQDNLLRIQDFATTVPGFTSAPTPSSGSTETLTIRGLTTGLGGGNTVGVVIDDVPYYGWSVPDIDPFDLSRIEVLRGPQGTLYGASAIGGLLKFVTVDPSTDRLSGRVEGGVSDVHNGGQAGYSFRASVNAPVNDTLAVRLSGFTRQDPGYLDNPVLGLSGLNQERVGGGRLAALWLPSKGFSVKLSALYQDTKGYGSNEIEVLPGLGDLQQDFARGTGGYDRQVQAYSATVKANWDGINFVSLTGYGISSTRDYADGSQGLSSTAESFFGVSAVPIADLFNTYTFSQELRLTGNIGSRFDWLVGGFYTRRHNNGDPQSLYASDPLTGQVAGYLGYNNNGPLTYQETAGFADLTYHATDRFEIQLGGRESQIQQHYSVSYSTGLIFGGDFVSPSFDVNTEHAFTYLVTPRYKLNDDLLVYARLASGFNPGGGGYNGPTALCTIDHFACDYDHNTSKDYELGIKGSAFEHVLSFDAAAYYISWTDLPVSLTNEQSHQTYTATAGSAKSEGVELSLQARPVSGLEISSWATWNEAVLTSIPPGNPGEASGDRLPYGARWSGNLSVQQDFPITGRLDGFAGATVTYIGDRYGTFTGSDTTPRSIYPGYAKTDLRLGARQGDWTGNLYVNNVTDRRAVIGGGNGTFPSYADVIIIPRTIGISVTRAF